jgi:hypothetical protein
MLNRLAAFALIALMGLSSCAKEEIVENTDINTVLASGTWKVAYFEETGVDETVTYTTYDVVFNADGTAISNPNQPYNSQVIVNGTWQSTVNPADNSIDLNIDLGEADRSGYLSGNWDVVEHTPNLIRLQDPNTRTGDIAYLTFEKQ